MKTEIPSISSVQQANNGLLDLMRLHLEMVQSGKFGKPTLKDLIFCGELHKLIEENQCTS